MPRITFRDFTGGLWLSSPSDDIPSTGLRRARGIHPLKTKSVRSRWGASLLFSRSAHSLIRFADARFQGSGTLLYRNATSIITGLSGQRLAMVRMPPTAGVADYLFVTGGGRVDKVDSAGATSKWGIVAPTTAPTASKVVAQSKSIDAFESAATWTDANGNLDLKTDEANIKLEGTNSLKIRVLPGSTGGVQKSIAVDLTTFGSTVSPDEDWISLAIRFDKPGRVDSMQLVFGLDGFFNTTYTKEIIIDDQVSRSHVLRPAGLADLAGVHGQEQVFLATPTSRPFRINTGELLGVTKASEVEDTWSVLLIPKAAFVRAGNLPGDWSNVGVVKILVRAAGATGGANKAIVYLDDLKLVGGVGKQGTYKLKYSYRNTVTGSRSNGSPEFEIKDVQREALAWAGLQPSSDPQVDQIELWETIGNGALFFKAGEVTNVTSTFDDTVADYIGLHSGEEATYLDGETPLPDDNDPPPVTYLDAFGPFDARMLWCRINEDGSRGHIAYSPVGRAEAVQGFVIATNDDDPAQKGVIWDGRAWVFSEGHLFEVVGTDVLVVREVFGVPGTTKPFTVVVTPLGIGYVATDGPRLFDGNASRLLGFSQVGTLFRGEAEAGLTAFEPTVAEYHQGEIYYSDGTQTLAYHLTEDSWRDVGVGMTALAHEDDTGSLIISTGNTVVEWEREGSLTDVSFPIPFVIEPAHQRIDAGKVGFVQRVYFDLNTKGQQLQATVLLDDVEFAYPTLVTSKRQTIDFPVLRSCERAGIRLFGAVAAQVEVFGIELDAYVP